MLLVLGCILVASPTYNRAVDCNAAKNTDDEKVVFEVCDHFFFNLCLISNRVTMNGRHIFCLSPDRSRH